MIVTVTFWSVFFFLLSVLVLLGLVAKRRNVLSILFVAFFLRFALAIYFVYAAGGDYYDTDSLISRAEDFSNIELSLLIQSIPFTAYIYSWSIGIIWNIIGYNDIMLISLINAFLGFLCCIVAYDLSSKLFSKKTATTILIIVAIFPTLLLQSAGFANRESFFILPFLTSLYLLYRYYTEGKLNQLLRSIVLAVFASIVHTAGIVLFVLIFVISAKTNKGRYTYALRLVLPILLLLVMYLMFTNGIGTEKFYGEVSIEQVGRIQESRSVGRAAYLEGMQINSIGEALLYGPIKVAYFVMAPFVWMVRNIADVYGLVDGLFYLALLVIIYKSGIFKRMKKNTDANSNVLLMRYFAYTLFAMMIVLAFGTSNYGTAMRHRAKLFIPLVVVAGVYVEQRNNIKLGRKLVA